MWWDNVLASGKLQDKIYRVLFHFPSPWLCLHVAFVLLRDFLNKFYKKNALCFPFIIFVQSLFIAPYVRVHSTQNIFLKENFDSSHISDRTIYWLWTLNSYLMEGCFLLTLESVRYPFAGDRGIWRIGGKMADRVKSTYSKKPRPRATFSTIIRLFSMWEVKINCHIKAEHDVKNCSATFATFGTTESVNRPSGSTTAHQPKQRHDKWEYCRIFTIWKCSIGQ